MARPTRAIAALAAAGALAATTLSGCQLITANAPVHTPSAVESCATGHSWELDTAALAPRVIDTLHDRGTDVTLTVDGSQQLTWDTDFSMRFTTDLTFTADMPAKPGFQEQHSVKGASNGVAYFSADIAVPRDWSADGLTVATTATQDGNEADPAFKWPNVVIDDTVGLKVTCSADQLVITPRQGKLVWTFKPAG